MTLIIDVSFEAEKMTADILKKKNIAGAIGYVNTVDPTKNLSKTRFQDWITNGLMVGLVFENMSTDALQGSAGGSANAHAAYQQAAALRYDIDNCVMFFAVDYNVQPVDYSVCADYFHAINHVIPYVGVYSNKGLMDYLAGQGLAKSFWQSNSTSYSNGLVSSHANLLQYYNDNRVAGLPVDANDILRSPVGLMGEDMSLDVNDKSWISSQLDTLGGNLASTLGSDPAHPYSHLNIISKLNQLLAVKFPTADDIAASIVSKLPAGNISSQDIAAAVRKEIATHLGV
jgi:hypothetical protein